MRPVSIRGFARANSLRVEANHAARSSVLGFDMALQGGEDRPLGVVEPAPDQRHRQAHERLGGRKGAERRHRGRLGLRCAGEPEAGAPVGHHLREAGRVAVDSPHDLLLLIASRTQRSSVRPRFLPMMTSQLRVAPSSWCPVIAVTKGCQRAWRVGSAIASHTSETGAATRRSSTISVMGSDDGEASIKWRTRSAETADRVPTRPCWTPPRSRARRRGGPPGRRSSA
jgi:hypothetical protein